MVKMNISQCRRTAEQVKENLLQRGLRVKTIGKNSIQLTIYADINEKQIVKAAEILNDYISECEGR